MLFPTTVFAVFFFIVFQLHWGLVGFPRTRKYVLLAASLFFYGWWSWKFALMLLGSALINHAAALRMKSMEDKEGTETRRKWLLIGIVALNLGLLGFFKYTNFFFADVFFPGLATVCGWIGPAAVDWVIRLQEDVYPIIARIVLPVGISFFTFQALSYVVDVYRDKTMPARSWLDFANYLAFFPQLVAGPIVRADHLVPQMEVMPNRQVSVEAGRALFLILCGLFKKTVVANWLAHNLADRIFDWARFADGFIEYSGPDILMGVYAYAIQIYCDFSAYSDIAIGTALLLGFRFPANFNAPYFATTLQDFWRRWHISLSSWLRDYLYIPLGGSRKSEGRTYMNLCITFLLGGLWHGAAWTFIFWGAFHGIYLAIERFLRRLLGIGGKGAPPAPWWIATLGRIWIFHVVCVSWVLFRGGNMDTVNMIWLGLREWRSVVPQVTLWGIWPVAVFVVGFCTQFCDGDRIWATMNKLPRIPAWVLTVVGVLILTIILALGPEGVSPFIYFQF